MKKTFFVLGCLLAIGFSSISCRDRDDDNDEITISEKQLPSNAKQFLATHFPNATISKIEKNKEDELYEIELSNGFEVSFNKDGDWVEVDANDMDVPNSIVSLVNKRLMDDINDRFPKAKVIRVVKVTDVVYDVEVLYRGNKITISNIFEIIRK